MIHPGFAAGFFAKFMRTINEMNFAELTPPMPVTPLRWTTT
jgi:hypothetical protein